MRLLLCHECYFWVAPRNGRCPECDHAVDSAVPDPPAEKLDRDIGSAVRPLGCVCLQREMLPERGTLYETEHGLYFVPHEMKREVEFVEKTEAGRSLFWTLVSIAFPPLILILPFVRFRKLRAEEVPVFEPKPMDEEQRSALGHLLLENPGAFYVPRKSIRRLKRRRRRWIIERRFGSALRLTPEHDGGRLDHELNDLISREPWKHMASH